MSMLENVNWAFNVKKYNENLMVPKSSPVVYKDHVMFGTDSGFFISVNRVTGKPNWYKDTKTNNPKGILSSPAVKDGIVYFGAYNGVLYAYDIETGDEVWRRRLCDWIGSSPCTVGDNVYIGLEHREKPRGSVVCIDRETAEVKWKFPVKEWLHGSPVYSKEHDMIVIGTNDKEIFSLGASTGILNKSLKVGDDIKYHAALKGDIAVFGSWDNCIYFWNFVTGELVKKIETSGKIYSRPLIVGDHAYVGSKDHHMYIIDMRDWSVDRIETDWLVYSSPTLHMGKVWFGSADGWLYQIDPDTKEAVKHTEFGQPLVNAPAGYMDDLFILTQQNTLYSLKVT
jgi:outer membrane protein assembly factor BamB